MANLLLHITPVLPSQDIGRDLAWYDRYLGFTEVSHDPRYAVLQREGHFLHLQWHADSSDDPLLGGSVVRLFVGDIGPLFREMVARGGVTEDALRRDTDWGTHEFGLYDLNHNAIFFVEDQ